MKNNLPRKITAISAVRTPTGKFGGTLKEIPVYHLGASVIRAACKKGGVSPNEIDECVLGCCRQAGNGTNPARTAALSAGLSKETPAATITMACASGMRAVILGIQTILSGDSEITAVGGMESMSTIPYLLLDARWKGFNHGSKMLVDGWYDSRDPFIANKGTAETTETLIAKYGITRAKQDQFALQSHQKASQARKKNLFKTEIVPIELETSERLKHFFTEDETIREDSTLEKLSKLKPVFGENGTLTAGNSSPLSDGAAALILTTKEKGRSLGARPLFSICSYAIGAVNNELMGEGPARVLPMALKKAGMSLKNIDFLEINEAFSGMVLANQKILETEKGWNPEKLNVKGGAIALGHPVGCSGARILVTLYHILKDFDGEIGAAAIGGAGGVAAAMVIQRHE
jgi:acetyl-CoA C-acetyltransferase